MTRLVIVMGVSGSGKTLVGKFLADKMGCLFVDGDDLHPPENVERMKAGTKLDDETRKPWLAAICATAEESFKEDQSIVIACSALKAKYRETLRSVSRPVWFVFLNGPQEVIQARMEKRKGHYMPTSLLDSQFADLEPPIDESNIVEIDVQQEIQEMLDSCWDAMKLNES